MRTRVNGQVSYSSRLRVAKSETETERSLRLPVSSLAEKMQIPGSAWEDPDAEKMQAFSCCFSRRPWLKGVGEKLKEHQVPSSGLHMHA